MFILFIIISITLVCYIFQTGVMLLESIGPVVDAIRGMEEEDGVPLSYPYPLPPAEEAANKSDCNVENSQDRLSLTSSSIQNASTDCKIRRGGTSTSHDLDNLPPSEVKDNQGRFYGSKGINPSTASAAALKWKTATLASSVISTQASLQLVVIKTLLFCSYCYTIYVLFFCFLLLYS
jgi:hypothetical protein